MYTIPLSQFQKIVEKLKPAKKLENSAPDLPDDGVNDNTSMESMDAQTDQANLQENLTEGHITGTGGPVRKNAAEVDPKQREIEHYNRLGREWSEELGVFNSPLFSTPLYAGMSLNKAVLSNPFTAALGYGGGAAALAAGTIGVKNWLKGQELTEEDKRRQRLQTLLAGLGGSAVGLGLRKWSSFGMPMGDPLTFIAMKLQDDTTMSTMQQQQMLTAVNQLSHTQQSGLAQLLTTVAGAGIGAVIAKFLMNMGIMGTIGGALMGGFFGSRAGRFPDNGPGTINNSVDFFGRPI